MSHQVDASHMTFKMFLCVILSNIDAAFFMRIAESTSVVVSLQRANSEVRAVQHDKLFSLNSNLQI